MISLEKLKNLSPLQKLPKNMGDLGSVTRSGDLFDFGQLLKAFGNN